MQLLNGVATTMGTTTSSASASFDDSEASFRSDAAPTAAMRPCVVEMAEAGAALLTAPKVSERALCVGRNEGGGAAGGGWSSYYGNVLTKQTLKGCL